MTEEEFEKFWEIAKSYDARREAEFNALSEEVRQRYEAERINHWEDRFGEDPLGGDDDRD